MTPLLVKLGWAEAAPDEAHQRPGQLSWLALVDWQGDTVLCVDQWGQLRRYAFGQVIVEGQLHPSWKPQDLNASWVRSLEHETHYP